MIVNSFGMFEEVWYDFWARFDIVMMLPNTQVCLQKLVSFVVRKVHISKETQLDSWILQEK